MQKFSKLMLACVWCLLGAAVVAQGPVATPSSKFQFDQPAPDVATANGYTFRLYADGAATGAIVAGVVCVAGATAGVQTCTMPFPAFTPGAHTVQLTAANVAGESPKSSPFAFTLVVIPGAPSNLRVITGS